MPSVKYNRLKLTDVKVVTSDPVIYVSDLAEQQKIQSSDIQANDRFGGAVAINSSGTIAITGAHFESTGGTYTGAAYVFTKDSSDIWNEQQKIQASDKETLDQFGWSVSMNAVGDTVIVSAFAENTGGADAGAAYVFTKDSSDIWNEQQKIQSSDIAANDGFGWSVSMNAAGDTVIVGTAGTNTEAAYIFTRNSSDIWNEQQKIVSSDFTAGDYFGQFVSINALGDIVLVGAPSESTGGAGAGAAYIFTKNSSDIWNEQQKIVSSDAAAGDYFGITVDLNDVGDISMIASAYKDSGAGAAYVFQKDSSDIWNEQQKIVSSDITAGDYFGSFISMNAFGNVAVISSPYGNTVGAYDGAAYIFTKNSSDIWNEQQKFQSSDVQAGDEFGHVAINSFGDTIISGAPKEDTGGADAGSAYIFQATTAGIVGSDVLYSDIQQYELFRMKSDIILHIKS